MKVKTPKYTCLNSKLDIKSIIKGKNKIKQIIAVKILLNTGIDNL